MITAEIAGVLLLLMGLLVYAMVRTARRGVVPEGKNGVRILIVDDDPDAVKIARRILETHGYEVSNASGGAEGLKMMRQTKPDLVLLDIMMDYITDGLDVSNAMRRDDSLRNIPVV